MLTYDVTWKQISTVLEWHGFTLPQDVHKPTKKLSLLLVMPLAKSACGLPAIARISKPTLLYRVEFLNTEEYMPR